MLLYKKICFSTNGFDIILHPGLFIVRTVLYCLFAVFIEIVLNYEKCDIPDMQVL